MSRLRVLGWISVLGLLYAGIAGCAGGCAGQTGAATSTTVDILTDTSFLADIVQNVAGDRLTVASLIPEGADPHSFEPTPSDARRVAEARAMVINVKGLLPSVDQLMAGAGGTDQLVIEAAAGIADLQADPHCWMDPLLVITYAQNIATGLAQLDPAGASTYWANAAAYAIKLRELDSWIKAQVETIPAASRLLVTDHESLGRFASRYGFKIVGAIFPTTSAEGSPSARQLTDLVAQIKATGAPAIFVETGSTIQLAQELGAEAGVKVVTDLYTHSLTAKAPTYVDMMRWDVTKIVEALR